MPPLPNPPARPEAEGAALKRVIRSVSVYQLAHEPKRLILYPGADHVLDEAAEEVHVAVRDWIVEHLQGEDQP